MSYQFLTKRGVIALHQQQILEHGGTPGIRENSLLESTLAKAQNLVAYVQKKFQWSWKLRLARDRKQR